MSSSCWQFCACLFALASIASIASIACLLCWLVVPVGVDVGDLCGTYYSTILYQNEKSDDAGDEQMESQCEENSLRGTNEQSNNTPRDE